MTQAPLLILGCHRSGTSAVTGLMHHAAGLHLGDVLPPSAANPRGYFESPAVVSAHRMILTEMARDWTCPPGEFEPSRSDVAAVTQALAPLIDGPQTWGVKDPRLLFMLPAWTTVIESVRFIGVVREPGSVTKSIARRDGIPEEAAGRIVAAYVKRLASLHKLMPFPIVNFDADPDATLSRVEKIARGLGLSWNDEEARKFFSPSLVHYRSRLSADENHHYLLEASTQPVDTIPAYTVGELTSALADPELVAVDPIPRTYGPRYLDRRRRVLRRVAEDVDDVEGLLELVPAESSSPALMEGKFLNHSIVPIPSEQTSIQRYLKDIIPPTHVMMTGLTDDLSAGDLSSLLFDLDLRTRTRASLFMEAPPDWDDSVRKAIEETSWEIGEVEEIPGGRPIIALYKRFDVFRSTDAPTDPRLVLLSFDARLSAMERERAFSREHSSQAEADNSSAKLKKTRDQNKKLKKQLAEATRRYDRLVGRRSVRLALRIADLFAPLFRWRRR